MARPYRAVLGCRGDATALQRRSVARDRRGGEFCWRQRTMRLCCGCAGEAQRYGRKPGAIACQRAQWLPVLGRRTNSGASRRFRRAAWHGGGEVACWEGGKACGQGGGARDLQPARCSDGEATGAGVGTPGACLLQTESAPSCWPRALGLVPALKPCLVGAGGVKSLIWVQEIGWFEQVCR